MENIDLTVYAYNSDGQLLLDYPILNHLRLPLGTPIPRVEEYFSYQYWEFKIFKVEYAYTEKSVFVTLKVIVNDAEIKTLNWGVAKR